MARLSFIYNTLTLFQAQKPSLSADRHLRRMVPLEPACILWVWLHQIHAQSNNILELLVMLVWWLPTEGVHKYKEHAFLGQNEGVDDRRSLLCFDLILFSANVYQSIEPFW